MSITPLPWAPQHHGRAMTPYFDLAKVPTRRLKSIHQNTKEDAGDLDKRNEQIIEYLPLVKFIATRISGRLPNHVEIDDLMESGIIGLIDAIEKFDPSHQIKFKTYAEFRIRGAILDELRALDWVPRSTRQKASRLERAYADLEMKHGRPATDSEMIEHLGVSREEFDDLVLEAKGAALISLDEMRGENEEGFEHTLLEYLASDEGGLTLPQSMSLEEAYRLVADTIDLLPEKERLVVSLYYYEELTMKEIGEIMNVTESRISQVHTKAILRLRGRILKAMEE